MIDKDNTFKDLYIQIPLTGYIGLIQGFFLGGTGGSPHLAKILSIPPPIWHLSPFLDQGLSPPPSRGSSPKNLKNLNTFLCQIWVLLSSKVP